MSVALALAALMVGAAPPARTLGVSLATHRSGASHLLFVDAVRRAQPWTPFIPGQGDFDSGAEVPVDDQGMPRVVPFQPSEGGPAQRVRTVFFEGLKGRYPAGRYVLEVSGDGELAVGGDAAAALLEAPGVFPLEIRPSSEGVRIEIRRSSAEDPLRDLHVWLPNRNSGRGSFPSVLLDRLRGFSVLRASDLMRVRGGDYPCDDPAVPPHALGCRQSWKTRARADAFTQASPRGVAAEHLVDLANRAGLDLWPGIPHAATDDWVRGLAKLLRDRLRPDLRVYIELSDEVWRPGRPQHAYFRALGAAQVRGAPSGVAARRAFARRTAQVWQLFAEVFEDEADARLIRVVPGFFARPSYAEELLADLGRPDVNRAGLPPDALSVGAWFGGTVADTLVAEGKAKRASVDEVLERLKASLGTREDPRSAETFAGLTRAHAALARHHGAALIAHAGGPRLVVGAGEPSPLNATLHAANRHPRMADLYARALDLWFGVGGRAFVVHALAAPFNAAGSFGHLEHMLQPVARAPKFRALRRRLIAFGADLPDPGGKRGPELVYARVGVFPGGGMFFFAPKPDEEGVRE